MPCLRIPVFVVFLLTMTAVSVAGRSNERPCMLLIYTDDQGYGDASHLNVESRISTPHIDRLAREGISFTDAHCSDTVCTPSRYGLLTGRYSWRTVLKRGVFGAERKCLITDGRMTLASLLKDNGYETAMIGKWHLGMDFPGEPGDRDWSQPVQDMPLDKGFDYFWGIPASLNYGILAWFEGRHAAVPPTLFTAKKPNQIAIADYRIKPPYDDSPQQTKRRLKKPGFEIAPDFVDSECLTRFTDKAVEYIRDHAQEARDGKPFFLYLPYTSPHKPVIPLPQFRGKSEAGAYGDFVVETDFHVGQLLKCLDDEQLTKNTMVIFTSDNGPETTWKERLKKYNHDSSGIYKEGKRSIYEGGHRVPFIVRWPDGISDAGRTCDATICQTDLLATFADVFSASLPDNAGEDSLSFLPVLRDRAAEFSRPAVIHHAANGRFAIRRGKWKLVLPHQKKKAELYDIDTDPGETSNVANDEPAIVAELTSHISTLVLRGRTSEGKPQKNDTSWWNDLTWLTEKDFDVP